MPFQLLGVLYPGPSVAKWMPSIVDQHLPALWVPRANLISCECLARDMTSSIRDSIILGCRLRFLRYFWGASLGGEFNTERQTDRRRIENGSQIDLN